VSTADRPGRELDGPATSSAEVSRAGRPDTGPNWMADIVLKVHTRQGRVVLRVSRDYTPELYDLLQADGLYPRWEIEESVVAGPLLDILSVPSASAAITGLTTVLCKFIGRHKDKEITFGTTGQLSSIKGYSAEDAMQLIQSVVDAAERRQLDQEQSLLEPTSSQARGHNSDISSTVDDRPHPQS
jgi:hypothetical protein